MLLRHGDTGYRVESLQRDLARAGHSLAIDGWYGDETEAAQSPPDAIDARGDVDTALTALSRTPGVSVIPEEDQKKLTPDDRAAAVMIGDRPKHLIAIEA